MTVTTDAEELVINKLTKAQYQAIENPSDTELYFITDDKVNYNDIENTPTIGEANITIQKNGNNVDTFSVNDVTDKTINIIVPESVSDLSDGSNYVEASDLSNVSFSGAYDDLINKPTIGDGLITIQKNGLTVDSFSVNSTTAKTINIIVPTKVTELSDGANYPVKSSLAAVATTDSFNDLIDKPTIGNATITLKKNGTTIDSFTTNATSNKSIDIVIPTRMSDLSDGGSYYTSTQVDEAISAAVSSVYKFKGSVSTYNNLPSTDLTEGDTYNVEDTGANYAWTGSVWDKLSDDLTNYVTLNGNQTLTNKTIALADNNVTGLSTVATSGSYNDLTNKPTIGNATLTIQKNGINVATFTANSTSNATANLEIPTKVSDIDNDLGFLTQHQSLANYVTLNTAQTITANKTYTAQNIFKRNSNDIRLINQYTNYTQGTAPTANQYSGIIIKDSAGTEIADFYGRVTTGNVNSAILSVKSPASGATTTATMGIHANADGTFYTNAPTPATNDSSTKIATTAFVKNQGYALDSAVVHNTGNETIAGTKTFSSTIQGTTLKATWADLAENYNSDTIYEEGTLIEFGGEKDITIANKKVNGVISTKPAFLMNREGKGQPVALAGRVPVKVEGEIHRFDKLTLKGNGIARKKKWYEFHKRTIAIALEKNLNKDVKKVLCVTKFNLD